jgi:hypothetical protein
MNKFEKFKPFGLETIDSHHNKNKFVSPYPSGPVKIG